MGAHKLIGGVIAGENIDRSGSDMGEAQWGQSEAELCSLIMKKSFAELYFLS